MLLGPVPRDLDRNTEIKDHLSMWEQGQWETLLLSLEGQQLRKEGTLEGDDPFKTARSKANKARRLANAGMVGKAIKNLKGGVAQGTREEK